MTSAMRHQVYCRAQPVVTTHIGLYTIARFIARHPTVYKKKQTSSQYQGQGQRSKNEKKNTRPKNQQGPASSYMEQKRSTRETHRYAAAWLCSSPFLWALKCFKYSSGTAVHGILMEGPDDAAPTSSSSSSRGRVCQAATSQLLLYIHTYSRPLFSRCHCPYPDRATRRVPSPTCISIRYLTAFVGLCRIAKAFLFWLLPWLSILFFFRYLRHTP